MSRTLSLINLSIVHLSMIRSTSSAPMFTSPMSIIFQNSHYSYFVSSLLNAYPKTAMFNRCLFSHFLSTPIRIQKKEISSIITETTQIFETNASFIDSSFINNTAIGLDFNESTGGALFILSVDSIIIQRCIFLYCIANNAGAIVLCNSNANISESVFDNCHAFQNAGAIWVMGMHNSQLIDEYGNSSYNELTISFSNFTNNQADDICGALNVNQSSTYLLNCNFYNNIAGSTVGAVALIGETEAYIEFAEFINNTIYNQTNHLVLNNDDFYICPALWLQGNEKYMKNVFRVGLDTIIFQNNIITQQNSNENIENNSNKKYAVSSYGVVSLFFKNMICFDGETKDFVRSSHKDFFGGQNFRNILFLNDTICPHKMNEETPPILATCPEIEFTSPFLENRMIKNKIALFLPLFMM